MSASPRVRAILLGLLCAAIPAGAAAAPAAQTAARLNNEGVAFMNQQFTEKALARFQDAFRADASSAIPLVNQGIALIYLNNLPDAKDKLTRATEAAAGNVRAWYALGVADFSAGSEDAALTAFRHAETLDPTDPDTHYFLGAILSSEKKFDEATVQFQTAIQLYPLHASAQFGLARVLQREGKPDEAREHVKRFREITDTKIGTLIGTSYGDQGRYATAQDILSVPPHAGAMIPVKFIPAPTGSTTALAPPASGSACILDLEGNGAKDIITPAPGDGLRAFRPAANGALTSIPAARTGLSAQGDGVACAVGDYDNDGLPDLALALKDRVILFHNLGHGRFADVTAAVGIKPLNRPASLTFVDYDHDGDLDLLVTGEATQAGPNLLWRNNGNSTFTEWSQPAGLAGTVPTRAAVLSDLNNDRAVDLIVAPAAGSPILYLNQREGPFKQLPLTTDTTLPPVRAITVSDLDKDGWMDLILTHNGAPSITLWRNLAGKGFQRIPLTLPGVKSAWGVTPVDFDNDSWIDLAAVVETAKGTELRVLRNLGSGNFADVSDQLGLTGLAFKGARAVLAADTDGKGATDLFVSQQDAPPLLLRNVGGNKNHSLRIDLTGLADNKSGIGTKVEVFSDGNWQKFEVSGASGYLGQGPTEILAGLGQSADASVVRLLWPTGVPQDELSIAANKPLALTELDRRGSSCPVLFAWDGSRYRFITDVIGAAVVGHWISPTAYNQSDTDEWVKIDGDLLKARNGNFSVRFGEPMEEINYIDQLRLVAVDHPANTAVYPDERFLSEAPFASGQTVVASPQTRPLAGAWDDHGRDVLATLTASHREDYRHYVRDFTNLTYAGFANPHTLTLDLGDWSANNPLRLFAHGYVEYFSASSMYAAWQAGIEPHPPAIQAQLPDGSWKTVIEDAGFPAGLPRTIVYDLTAKLPPHTRRIRLRTNLQIYWDGILVDNGPDSAAVVRQTELPLTAAHLAFRGYPKQIERETPGDLTYDYQSISQTGPFGWQRGNYTHYGNVTPLLTARDDHYVIFGSGEDIDAEFSDAQLPKLPTGWKRDYFFYADGFVKDMDFYEALPFTVTELPFHNMSGYPYPNQEHFPDDSATLNYELNWNDRTESGNRTQLNQFHYKPTPSEPVISKPH